MFTFGKTDGNCASKDPSPGILPSLLHKLDIESRCSQSPPGGSKLIDSFKKRGTGYRQRALKSSSKLSA